jgi:sugar-specific transcriptional regulator TrmB
MKPDAQTLTTLSRLGFSDMEAAIYLDLLTHPGATGYGIGKSISKPHANVYQGLTSLEQKGAVMFEDGPSRTFTAVPPAELLDQLRRRYEADLAQAASALETVQAGEAEPERFYRLTSTDQVFSRARSMLRGAQETVLIEAFPGLVKEFRSDAEDAIARGVSVAGIVMEEDDRLEGANLNLSQMVDRIKKAWSGQQLTIIVDAREFLLALLDAEKGSVKRALWVSSPYVASILNNGIVADVILHQLPEARQIKSPNEHVFGRLPAAFRQILEGQSA